MQSARKRGFFGRRKTKALSPRRQKLMTDLLPGLLVDIGQPCPDDPRDLFHPRPEKLVMEIGFGAGEHLLAQAAASPETGFIGIEPFVNSMASALSEIERLKLNNIRLFNEDAAILLDWLSPACLERIDLLYPDPWPKKRHWKRRFVNPENLARFAKVLNNDGMVRFASDIDTYVNWTLQEFYRHHSFEWLATCSADWKNPWKGWPSTRYEKKAVREGRKPAYLRFCRVA